MPSRIHHGQFYALPQSPQLFKQLLMMAGFDRYYQIVKCFRDEDLRADRQAEFTQIDIETSFLDELEIRAITEGLRAQRCSRKSSASICPTRFRSQIRRCDARLRFGQAGPARRRSLTELTDLMRATDFKVFRAAADLPNGRVAALNVRGGNTLTRKEIDDYTAFVKITAPAGSPTSRSMTHRSRRGGLQSPIVKFSPLGSSPAFWSVRAPKPVTSSSLAPTAKRSSTTHWARYGPKSATTALCRAGWKPLWVVDFPMFEFDDLTKTWAARHHPFTAPKDGHEQVLDADPGNALAKAYDVVLNGWEIGGGSVRIHQQDVQAKIFAALKISPKDQQKKFGFLLDALQYGAPPHGGIAFGLDRW